jgi:uncharacterized protein YunC (DUF1805 family)
MYHQKYPPDTFFYELGSLPLVIVKCKRGYIATTYISKDMAEKVGDVAGFVKGVKTLDDFMKSKLKEVTSWGDNAGLRDGMTVKRAIEILNSEEKE